MTSKTFTPFGPTLVERAVLDAFKKLDLGVQWRNLAMFLAHVRRIVTGVLFFALVVGTVLLVRLLTYVPALSLGPVIEHLTLWK
jgi:high-affinity K+ transport system ATPase subunit B